MSRRGLCTCIGIDPVLLLVFVLSGVLEPPIQTVPVHNTSAVDVRYWVDTEALTALAKENYGFQILKCLNPDVRERSVQLALPHALVDLWRCPCSLFDRA